MSGKAILYKGEVYRGGISSELVNKIGSATLTTTAPDLSGAVNELNMSKAAKATTLSGYGITDAKITSGTITLGANSITPLTSASTLNAAKLSGTIPSECYTDTNNAVTQTATDSTNSTYELLFSGTADNTTRTEGVRKSSNLIYNPYNKHIFMYDANNEEMVRIGVDESVNYNSGAVVVRDTDYDYVSLDLNGISSSYDLGLSSREGVHVWYSFGNAHGLLYCGDIMKGDNNDTWDGTNTSLEDALTDKATKATTLAGYGITDAKITNGTITLGSNSITPLTSHQDISGKVNKSGDTMTGALTSNTAHGGSWNKARDNAFIRSHGFANQGSYYPAISWLHQGGNWSIGSLGNSNALYFSHVRDTEYSGNNYSDNYSLIPTADGNAHSYVIAHSGNVGTGDSNGQVKIAGVNVSVKGWTNFLPLAGGTLTNNLTLSAGSCYVSNGGLYVTKTGGETQVVCKNGTANKQIYMYANTSGEVGMYSSYEYILRKDSNKKEYLYGATYYVDNAANFRSAIGAAASSSRLTKTDIQDMTEEEARKILNLEVKSFKYKDGFVVDADKHNRDYGIIAEDVKDIIPSVVSIPPEYDADNFDENEGLGQPLMTVNYASFVPYILKVLQMQQKEINKLKGE